jgi:hypothetical protein
MSQLYVQTDGVRSYAQTHDRIAAGLSQVIGEGAMEAAGVQNSHGTIAAAVGTALSSALETRLGALQTTARSGATISELLQKAAQMYEQGDRQGAEKLRAAAEVLEGQRDGQDAGTPSASGGPGGPAAGVPAAGVAGGPAGGQMIGQVLGQVGQQVGQLAGSLTAPLLGLAQGLQQVPQQVMQSVQGTAGSARDDETPPRAGEKAERTREPSDRDSQEPSEPTQRAEPSTDGAASGESTSGRVPEAPAGAERPRPAQTRPQAD